MKSYWSETSFTLISTERRARVGVPRPAAPSCGWDGYRAWALSCCLRLDWSSQSHLRAFLIRKDQTGRNLRLLLIVTYFLMSFSRGRACLSAFIIHQMEKWVPPARVLQLQGSTSWWGTKNKHTGTSSEKQCGSFPPDITRNRRHTPPAGLEEDLSGHVTFGHFLYFWVDILRILFYYFLPSIYMTDYFVFLCIYLLFCILKWFQLPVAARGR